MVRAVVGAGGTCTCVLNVIVYTCSGSFIHFTQHAEPTWRIRRLLETFSLLQDPAEIDAAEHFILRCLCLVPEERATAKELADDPWLTHWYSSSVMSG